MLFTNLERTRSTKEKARSAATLDQMYKQPRLLVHLSMLNALACYVRSAKEENRLPWEKRHLFMQNLPLYRPRGCALQSLLEVVIFIETLTIQF